MEAVKSLSEYQQRQAEKLLAVQTKLSLIKREFLETLIEKSFRTSLNHYEAACKFELEEEAEIVEAEREAMRRG